MPIDLDAESLVLWRSHFLFELALELLVVSCIHPGDMLDLHGIDWASDDVLEALILDEGLESVALFNSLEDFQSILNGLAKLKAERDVLIKLATQSILHLHKHDNYLKYKLLTILQFFA